MTIAQLWERTVALLREGTLPVMLPLILCAIGILVLVVERGLYLYGAQGFLVWVWPPLRRRISVANFAVARAVDAYIERPNASTRDTVLDACHGHRTPYTSFVSRVVAEDAFVSPTIKELHLAEAALREEMAIVSRLGILSMLAKLAPLLGLMGTVTGMIQTFRVMMLSSTSDPRALSSGISIALIATEVGLAVSLPGVIGSSWLHRRAEGLLEEIYLLSMRLRQAVPERFRKAA